MKREFKDLIRIKAIVTSVMYDIPGFGNNADNGTWQNTVKDLAKTRWEDVDNGYPGYKAAYEKANEPKEMHVVEGAMHIDLYDDTSKIPFDKIESFLRENLE